MTFSIIERCKYLQKVLVKYVPKFLDFTDYKLIKARVKNLETQVEYLQNRILYGVQIDTWYTQISKLLIPINHNLKLERVGSHSDGGYDVPLIKNFPNSWVTIGLGYNVEFENKMQKKGFNVYTFDHTVKTRPAKLLKNVNFFKLGWGVNSTETISLLDIIKKTQIKSNWGLKFDIEGSEWPLLHQLFDLHSHPSIIICELHDLYWENDNLKNTHKLQTIKKIKRMYYIISINGNNFSAEIISKNSTMNGVIELTLIRKNLFTPKKNTKKQSFTQYNHKNNTVGRKSIFQIRAKQKV
jgi:hypothetical protein